MATNRTPPVSINRLQLSQQFALMKLVEAEYAASKKLDVDFAVYAQSLLGFTVSIGNIQGCREALGLQSNRDALWEENKKPKNRLEAIEQRLEKLEALAKELGWKL